MIKCKFIDDVTIDETDERYKNYCQNCEGQNLRKFRNKSLFRLSLKCTINDKGKEKITVILMNPSFADEYGLDATLNNVKTFLSDLKDNYSEFEVLNIFPIRTPNSKDLLPLLKKYDSKCKYRKLNKEYIIEALKNSNKVLVAWGDKYHKEAQWIFEYLQEGKIYAYHLNKSGSPTHFSPQAYNRVENKELFPVQIFRKTNNNYYFGKIESGRVGKATLNRK